MVNLKDNVLERRFGPYATFPLVSISIGDERSDLIRTIVEEERKIEVEQEGTPNENGFYRLLKFLFVYSPSKSRTIEPEVRVIGRETLAEGVKSFNIEEKDGGFYVVAR
ncbi:hypothetical protein J4218_03710 [Candidatus Pacearchaeota archaeon]|nr:hypothetical protein [Candidatus Pacearchaeota archaeon]